MHPKKIDQLNIGLILISLIVSFFIPFDLFLFSYAFLGPLHYLTEINWLNQKGYFIKSNEKFWKYFYITICVLCSCIGVYGFIGSLQNTFLKLISDLNLLLTGILFFSIAVIVLDKVIHLVFAFFVSFLLAFLINFYWTPTMLILCMLIPTLVHVFVFTVLFMIYGAMQSNSKIGFVGVILMLLSLLLICIVPIDPSAYHLSEYTQAAFGVTGMQTLIDMSNQIFAENPARFNFEDLNIIGIKTQICIAFAYTYHYLNWFSKTSIIGWKTALSKSKTFYVVFIWLLSVYIYYRDYQLGYFVLFFLSFVHVLLEFPLNMITIKALFAFQKPKRMIKSPPSG